jgi:2-oxoglutarate ferredoxin oxidoreductase subunit beta
MTLHGRAVTIASGVHLANTDLVTFAITGDGDGFGIGIGHVIHNMRRNMDIVHIVENNEVYGLTKGQYSPTSKRGFRTSTSPEGAIEFSINPLALALSAGATFIGRSFSGDPKHAADVIKQAMEHKGYALVEILQTCPTYNKVQNVEWYKAQTYKILEENPEYDCTDPFQAFQLSMLNDGRYPMGILYKNTERPCYSEQVPALQQNKGALVNHSLEIDPVLFEKLKAAYV